MEKTTWRNIMAIYEDWKIFRKILKRDLALNRTSGRCGSRRRVGGEDDLRGSSEIRSVVAGVGVIGAVLIYTSSMSSPTSSALMIHEIDPTVKIWPGCGRDEEPMERTILFDIETARTPLPGAPTVDRISSVVLRGYPTKVD